MVEGIPHQCGVVRQLKFFEQARTHHKARIGSAVDEEDVIFNMKRPFSYE